MNPSVWFATILPNFISRDACELKKIAWDAPLPHERTVRWKRLELTYS